MRQGSHNHMSSLRFLALLTTDIFPFGSTIDTSYSPSCAPFAAAPFLKTVPVHIVATALAKNNWFSRFAIVASHCFIADGTVPFKVSLYTVNSVIWTGICFWIGTCNFVKPLPNKLTG
ncbi:hypothetical protein KC19_VG327900 [Ceratodon purpureus]|uniref:Uncharacterized protein n=1 Tax=Ceratodon purpureus TaxID=3225 RepID=A0A8T0HVW0_CERPU|nr:hypothetical protein KC19_VG327900 [Ceratodon purpureus]